MAIMMVYKPTHITGGGVMYIYIYLLNNFIIYILYIYTCKGTQYIHSMGIFITKDAQLNQAGSMGEIVKSGIVNSNGYAMDVFLPPMDVIIGVLIHILGNIYICILVGGLEHEWIIFPYIGDFIFPTDEVIFFRGVETTNQYCIDP